MAAQKGARNGGPAPGAVTETDGAAAEPTPDANVDKIREILFGGQMQDYELRFTALENRLASAAAELREETRTRLDALEAFTKKEMSALGDRLSAERRERTEALATAAADAAAADSAIDLRVDALDERASGDVSELRDQLLQQSKSLGDDLRRVQRALADQLEQEVLALRTAKADRQALAGMLADVAMRLSEAHGAETAEAAAS